MVDELSCSSKHGDATKRYRVGKKGETRSLLAGRSAGGEGELSSHRRLLTRLRAKAEESGGALVNGVVGEVSRHKSTISTYRVNRFLL